jgi:hypothetical protein
VILVVSLSLILYTISPSLIPAFAP